MIKYHLANRIMHWSMAILIFLLLILGFIMTNIELNNKFFYYNLHKSFGVLILGMLILRLYFKLRYKAPKLPFKVSKIEFRLKNIVFISLYLLMFMMPLSGWLMSNAKGYSVKLFGLVLPKLTPKNAFLAETAQLAHGYLAFMMLFFISLHLFAVIKHFFYDKINIIKRIW